MSSYSLTPPRRGPAQWESASQEFVGLHGMPALLGVVPGARAGGGSFVQKGVFMRGGLFGVD